MYIDNGRVEFYNNPRYFNLLPDTEIDWISIPPEYPETFSNPLLAEFGR